MGTNVRTRGYQEMEKLFGNELKSIPDILLPPGLSKQVNYNFLLNISELI